MFLLYISESTFKNFLLEIRTLMAENNWSQPNSFRPYFLKLEYRIPSPSILLQLWQVECSVLVIWHNEQFSAPCNGFKVLLMSS